jgi:hypothetical protein
MQRIAVPTAALPAQIQHLPRREIGLCITVAEFNTIAEVVQRLWNLALLEKRVYVGTTHNRVETRVAGIATGETVVLRDRLAGRGEHQAGWIIGPVERHRDRCADATTLPPGSA